MPRKLGQATEEFFRGHFTTRASSLKTRQAYRCDLGQFLRHAGPDRLVNDLKEADIESWIAELTEHHYAPASIQRKLVCLRVFFTHWVRRGEIDRSPFWGLRTSLGRRQVLPQVLDRGEIRRLLKAAQRDVQGAQQSERVRYLAIRNQALVDLLLSTGLRVGEAANLAVSDVSLDEGRLRVRGKGDRMRQAFLVDATSLAVQRLHLVYRRGWAAPQGPLFLNHRGRRLSPDGMGFVVRTLASRAGLARRVTPHMLRHTAATLFLQNGADLRVVQEFLGHASIRSTQRYTQVSKGHLVSVLRKHHPLRAFR